LSPTTPINSKRMRKTISSLLFPLVSLGFVIGNPIAIQAQTVPFPDNATFFTGDPPSLVSVDTPYTDINEPNAKYYFTIALPQGEIEALGQVSIHQQVSGDPINFDLTKTEVFLGNPPQSGASLAHQIVAGGNDGKTLVISLDPPVSPGNTVTIGLFAQQNPSLEGVYQFRVQAFPAGSSPVGLDLGIGRLQFYNNR